MSHCMIAAVGKGIDRAHSMSKKRAEVRLPPSWSMLSQGRQALVCMEDGTLVMWLGLAFHIFFVVRRVRAVGIREWQIPSRVSFDARVPNVFARRSTGGVREQIDRHGSADQIHGAEVR